MRFTNVIPIHPPSTASRNIDGSGRTGRNAAPTITSSGLQDPTGRTNPFSLPAAGPPRRPSMPCVGQRLRLPGSTSVQPVCGATEELKRKYNLNNLEVRQLPIEQVSDLKASFDQIICTGVLHHLAKPDAGLRALRDVLKPDGGRCNSWCMRLTDGPASTCCRNSADESASMPMMRIRDLITALRALPRGHPLEALLRDAPDFREEAALADALLNPQDRAYSVPQLFDLLEKAGLTFGRWLKQAPYTPHCGAVATIPQASRLARLSLAEQYAAVELFRGTMVRHSVIAYRNDSPGGAQRISFAGDAWLDYVPLRMPDTMCVQDACPPGRRPF